MALFLFYKELKLFSVDPNYAKTIGMPVNVMHYGLLLFLSLTVVVGIQAVGTVLTNALLVVPVAAARLLTDRLGRMMALSCIFAVLSALGGVYASYYFGTASGASIVMFCALIFAVAWVFKFIQELWIRRRTVMRWVLLCMCILLVARPAPVWPQNQPKLGAATLKFIRNNIDYQVVSFESLYFGYMPPVDVEHPDGNITKGTKKPMPIPKEIAALNGKKVAIKGFVIPLANSEGQRIKEFLFADELVSCLFCAMLDYDQWMVGTTVDSKGFNIKDDQFEDPITIYGTLEIGPKFEDGEFTGIYRIKADGFEPGKKKFLGIF